jgi:hypothetical protein
MDIDKTMQFILETQAQLEASAAMHDERLARLEGVAGEHDARIARIEASIGSLTDLVGRSHRLNFAWWNAWTGSVNTNSTPTSA